MLSAEQQKAIEDSLWVVNTVLKELGLQNNEDLRQEANLYLCKRIGNFDPARKTKWTTYAYKITTRYVKTIERRQSEKARHYLDFSSFADNTDDLVVAQQSMVAVPSHCLILKDCTDEEKRIIQLKLKGYKNYEIGQIQGQSSRHIGEKLKIIREKLLKSVKNS